MNCNTCKGFGLWGLGDASPMGPMDAEDGSPTIACPECGSNANPLEETPVVDPDKFAWNLGDIKVIPPKEEEVVQQFFLCDCGCDALMLEKMLLNEDDPQSRHLFISVWNRGTGKIANKLPMGVRIKWAWKMLRNGNPYGDEVTMTAEGALKVRDWLTEHFGS